jgi:hypothetical protein
VRTYKRKPGQVKPERRMLAAVRRRAEGMSLRQIADYLCCSHETIRRDLARWDREHANVTPLSHPPVTNTPPRGHFVTPECDSESNVVALRRKA